VIGAVIHCCCLSGNSGWNMYQVLAPGWVFESIWKYLNTQASIWVFKYYLNTGFCRVFRKVFTYFTHGICPNTGHVLG